MVYTNAHAGTRAGNTQNLTEGLFHRQTLALTCFCKVSVKTGDRTEFSQESSTFLSSFYRPKCLLPKTQMCSLPCPLHAKQDRTSWPPLPDPFFLTSKPMTLLQSLLHVLPSDFRCLASRLCPRDALGTWANSTSLTLPSPPVLLRLV